MEHLPTTSPPEEVVSSSHTLREDHISEVHDSENKKPKTKIFL
jgi:hypothetical protein